MSPAGRVAVNTARRSAAGAALVAAVLTGPAVAKADTGPAPAGGRAYVLPTAGRWTAERERMYGALRRYVAGRSASAIPAFARKYGMRCSACHFSVPVLNAFGQAFKDNGFRMKVGTDDLRSNEPAYWPVFGWLWKGYEFDAVRSNGQTVQQQGGITNGALVFGALGSVSDNLSFRMVPIIYEDGRTILDHGWIRYNQALGTDWLNIKVGATDLDWPINPGRDYNMGNARFGVMNAYRIPGSVSGFSILAPPSGIELMGHDRGSLNRYVVTVFNAPGAPHAHCTFCSPGVYGRVSRRFQVAEGFLRDFQVGAFGAYTTWPVGVDTSDLKPQKRLGADLEFILGSDALPLRVTMIGMRGQDDLALIPGAVVDPTFNAGLIQLEEVPSLPVVFYGRFQVIHNDRQGLAGVPDTFGDQDLQLVGAHYLLDFTSRFDGYLELSYSRQRIRHATPLGADVTDHILYFGTHLIF